METIYPFTRYTNFLSPEDSCRIHEECQFKTHYIYGERDHRSLPPTGMVKQITDNNIVYDTIVGKINTTLIPQIEHPIRFIRSYINFFHPKENAYFHQDGHCLTYMYYPDDGAYDDDEDGYTLFDYGGIVYAERPIPNSLVRFYGNIRHKAMPFNTKNRYTIVAKYAFE